MERVKSVNPQRIEWCLADRGVTADVCSSETGIALKTLIRVLAGEDVLTVGQLKKLADYFSRGMLFFLERGPVNETKLRSPQFRTLANQKPEMSARLKALIERTEWQREVFKSLRDEIDAEIPRYAPPKIDVADERGAASRVREWLSLSVRNDFDSYRAAIEAKGILVFRSNGYNGKWQISKESPVIGFSLFDPECPVIFVRKLRWEQRQSFTLFHELAHILLDRRSSIDDDTDLICDDGFEARANHFAGLVLVPDEFLVSVSDDARPSDVSGFDAWLDPHRKLWGVSGEVILRRLRDTGRLSHELYLNYRAWKRQFDLRETDDEGGSRKYRHREPKHVFGDPFVRVVLHALGDRRITLSKATTYLDNLKVRDLHMLESHCAGV